MIGRLIIGGAMALALAGTAQAMLAPQYYEQARTEARDVFTIDMETVEKPAGSYGECKVSGVVVEVERGTAFKVGQKATLAVSCTVGPDSPPPGPQVWSPYTRLTANKKLKAWTNDGVIARDQVEVFGRR